MIDHQTLLTLITGTEPMELKAVQLRRAEGTPAREDVVAATRQLVEYTHQCDKLATQFASMSPTPVDDPALVEGFAL